MDTSHPLLKNRIIFYLITAAFILFTVGAVLFFMINVRIKNVIVENCVYSEEQSVLSAASIKKGTHSYGISKDKISDAIKKKNPYVSDVRIKRRGIDTLIITVTEDKPNFYMEFGGRYLVLSAELRVLDEYARREDMPFSDISPIKIDHVSNAELGKVPVFEEEFRADALEYVSFLTKINESPLAGCITSADFTLRFDIRMVYKDKYEIRFGSPENFEKKLSLVARTIAFLEDPANNYSGAKGIIRATVDGETSFEPTGAIT